MVLAPNDGGNCTWIFWSSPDRMVAPRPSKVTATSLPLKCDPLMIAKDPGDTAPTSRRAALPALCRTTFGAAVTTGGGVIVAGVGVGAAVMVAVIGSVWNPDAGP